MVPSNKQKLKAIIFDMDGVITMSMPYHVRAWSMVFAGEGIQLNKSEIYAREGQKGIVGLLEIFAQHEKKITHAQAKILLHKKEIIFKKIVKLRYIAGARLFIRKYYHHDVKLAIVTGTSRLELKQLLPEKLIYKFKVIITGNDVTHGKPHPEPYRKALQALKVHRENAVVIENAPLGITSAIKAGLVCIALETSLPRSYLKEATKIVGDYQGLEQFIKQHYLL
ncbi:MAG: HAD family phosphatase [Candidatus Omnitrophota bacterium]